MIAKKNPVDEWISRCVDGIYQIPAGFYTAWVIIGRLQASCGEPPAGCEWAAVFSEAECLDVVTWNGKYGPPTDLLPSNPEYLI